MSIFRAALLETLLESRPDEHPREIADRYEAKLAKEAGGQRRYIKYSKITPSQDCVDAAHAMRDAKTSIRSIAKHFRVSCWTVRKWLVIGRRELPTS